jgi:hypothetical protein
MLWNSGKFDTFLPDFCQNVFYAFTDNKTLCKFLWSKRRGVLIPENLPHNSNFKINVKIPFSKETGITCTLLVFFKAIQINRIATKKKQSNKI